jgi:hypothetical protein
MPKAPWIPKHPAPADWPTLADYQEARRARWAAEPVDSAPAPKKARPKR